MELLRLWCLAWAWSLESGDNCHRMLPMSVQRHTFLDQVPSANNKMRRETQDVNLQVGDVGEGGGRWQKLLEVLEHLA